MNDQPGTPVITYECYRTGFLKRKWDFRIVHRNGNILCVSKQGYNNQGDLFAVIRTIKRSGMDGVVVIVDKP